MTDEQLLDAAAALIDQLDALHGDADFEADCDELAPPVWKIGAFIASGADTSAIRARIQAIVEGHK